MPKNTAIEKNSNKQSGDGSPEVTDIFKLTHKRFKVVAVSENCNSFGLRSHVMMACDGETWEVAASHLHGKELGEVLTVPCINYCPQWHQLSFEIPERLVNAPPAVVAEAWEETDEN